MHTDTDTDVNTDTVTGTHIIHILRIIRNWHQIQLRAHIPSTFNFLDSQSLTRFTGILPRSSHEIPGTGHLILDTIDGLLDD